MENKKQFIMAGSLAVIMTALTVTACGGAKVAASAQGTATTQGSAAGQWTKAEVSKFTAASGAAASLNSWYVRHRVLRAGHVVRERDGGNVGGPGIGHHVRRSD